MCHRVHVTLSVEDKKDVKKLSDIVIPVYASIVLGLIAVAGSQGDLVASTAASTTAR